MAPPNRNPTTKKPSLDENSEESIRKNKSKTAAPKRKNQSDEDPSSSDPNSDSEPRKKRKQSKSSTPPMKKKKTISIPDSVSYESTTKDSENENTGDSTESVYFQVRHVNGNWEYVIVPEHVDYILGLIDRDKAFPEFVNAMKTLMSAQRTVCRRFFEAKRWDSESVRKAVDSLTNSLKQ